MAALTQRMSACAVWLSVFQYELNSLSLRVEMRAVSEGCSSAMKKHFSDKWIYSSGPNELTPAAITTGVNSK